MSNKTRFVWKLMGKILRSKHNIYSFILLNICPTIDMSYFSGGAEFLPSTVFGVSRGGPRYQKLLGFEYKDIRYTKDE